MKKKESDQIIEALLFANPDPINQALLNHVFDKPIPSIKEAIAIKDTKLQTYIVDHIAQQMKRSHLNWNQTNVQDAKIWNDLEQFSEKKIALDKTKIIPVFQTTPPRKKHFFKKTNKKHYSRK